MTETILIVDDEKEIVEILDYLGVTVALLQNRQRRAGLAAAGVMVDHQFFIAHAESRKSRVRLFYNNDLSESTGIPE